MDGEIEDWMQDGQRRDDVRPIDLTVAVAASLRRGKFLEARPLLEDALQRPADFGREVLVLFKTLTLIAGDHLDEARECLSHSNQGMLSETYRDLHKLLDRTLLVEKKGPEDRTSLGAIAMLIDRYKWDESRKFFLHSARYCIDAIARHRPDRRGWIRRQCRALLLYRLPVFFYNMRVALLVGLILALYAIFLGMYGEVD
jgi:hypothetical protein